MLRHTHPARLGLCILFLLFFILETLRRLLDLRHTVGNRRLSRCFGIDDGDIQFFRIVDNVEFAVHPADNVRIGHFRFLHGGGNESCGIVEFRSGLVDTFPLVELGKQGSGFFVQGLQVGGKATCRLRVLIRLFAFVFR